MELAPFQAFIGSGQARMVMTAHIFNAHLDPAGPATLSHASITGLLREQMGHEGVVASDDMQTRGTDRPVLPANPRGEGAHVLSGSEAPALVGGTPEEARDAFRHACIVPE